MSLGGKAKSLRWDTLLGLSPSGRAWSDGCRAVGALATTPDIIEVKQADRLFEMSFQMGMRLADAYGLASIAEYRD